MIINDLELKNFRNLNLHIDPAPGFNLIVGRNGVGKSNMLDALYHLSLVKSFKPYILKNNINFNQEDFALINAIVISEDISKELRIVFTNTEDNGERKRLSVNSKATTKAKFINNLSLILFAPHNTNLLVSTPDVRRSELNDFGAALDFRYSMKMNEYVSILKSRNSLLRVISEGYSGTNELDYWDERLAKLGGEVIKMRLEIISKLGPYINELARTYFSPELEGLELNYISKFMTDEPGASMLIKIKENRNKEIAAGQSLYGPQKDDFLIQHQGKDLKLFGSRGQQRIATLLLKLAMWEQLHKIRDQKPLMLLDDVMAELDEKNRNKMEEILLTLKCQTFIATTHENDYSSKLLKKMEKFRLD